MKDAYLIDVGVLLTEDNELYDEIYASVYDERYGYFDEGQFYVATQEEGIQYVQDYVKNGVNNTYGIVSKTQVHDYLDFDDHCVEDEDYLVENIVFSLRKDDNRDLIENFITI